MARRRHAVPLRARHGPAADPVTVFGNRLLPKSGPWMETVKTAFGFVILALPVFLLERIIGDVWGTRLWAMLGVAFFSWAFIVSLGRRNRGCACYRSFCWPRAGERPSATGLGVWHPGRSNAGSSEFYTD